MPLIGKYRNISVLLLIIYCNYIFCENKYSASANLKYVDIPETNLRDLDKPFRMAKLNLLFTKAQARLTLTKLKSLFGELKIHDKEEMTWKRLRAEGLDKDGLKEAELRKKLIGIMSTYDLLEHFEDVQNKEKHAPHKAFNEASDVHINKSLFKDKKLNKLWSKAEIAGFTPQELQALKEEFNHHQEKVDQYYSLLQDVQEGPKDQHENSIDEKLDRFNTLDRGEEAPNKDYIDKANSLREAHRDLRDGYDRLHRMAAKGPNSKEFVEPKVQGLWKMAIETQFTPDELESLRIELMHYENRLLKLRHLQAEQALGEHRQKEKDVNMAGVKTDGVLKMEENIKKQARKIEKMHLDLETKIMRKHIEL